MTGKESAIEKVRKLLALAAADGGGTEAERNLALERAQEIMLKHDLAALAVEAAVEGAAAFAEDHERIEGMSNFWRGQMFARLGRVVGVHVHYSSVGRKVRYYDLIGRPDQIAFLKRVVEFLAPQFEIEAEAAFVAAKAEGATQRCGGCDGDGWKGWTTCEQCRGTGQAHLNRRVFKRDFYRSATAQVASRMRRQRRKLENAQASAGGMELVRQDKAALEAFVAEQYPDLRSVASRTSGGSGHGRAAGNAAGKRADLMGGANLGAQGGALTAGGSE